MDKNKARDLLVQATGLLQLKRDEHQAVGQALELLKPNNQNEENDNKDILKKDKTNND